jgi:hypothetical protein
MLVFAAERILNLAKDFSGTTAQPERMVTE